MARARGEYVLFLDSDDLLHPNHLATLHTHIQAQARPNFIATKYNFNRNGHTSSTTTLLPYRPGSTASIYL